MGVFSDLNHAFKLGKSSQKAGDTLPPQRTQAPPQTGAQTSGPAQPSPWHKVPPKNNQISAWSGQLPNLTQRWYHWFYICALDRPTADGRYSPRLKPNYTHELYLGVLSLDTNERRILFHSQFQVPLPSSLGDSTVTNPTVETALIRDQVAEKIGDLFAQMVGATKGTEYLLYPRADWWLPVLQACYRRITQQMESAMDCTAG